MIYNNEMNSPIQSRNNTTNNNQLKVSTLPEIARKVTKLEKTQLNEKRYIAYEIIACTFLLGLIKDGNNPKTTLYLSLQQSMGCPNTTDMEDLVNRLKARGGQDQLLMFFTGPAGSGKSTAVMVFAGNVGVVSGIFPPQNDRHADMSAPCRQHDTDHVGDIAPCRLAGRRVGVVSARVNCDVSAPCRRYVARA